MASLPNTNSRIAQISSGTGDEPVTASVPPPLLTDPEPEPEPEPDPEPEPEPEPEPD